MKRPTSLAYVLTVRVGMMKAARLMGFLALYGAACVEADRKVTMEEFAASGFYSTAGCYRFLRLFREAIPEFDHPYDLVVAVAEHRAGEFAPLGSMWGAA